MRYAAALLGVLFIAIVVAVSLRADNGYVLLAWGDTTVEMSLAMLALLATLLFALIWAVLRLLIGTWRLPARLAALRKRQRLRKAQHSLTRGLIEMSEGRWRDGERSLLRYARHSPTPLPHYLVAARAAQMQGEHDRRDNHLKLAYETTPAATTAVLLTQAELQLVDGQYERALATLNRLRELAPNHAFALRLLAQLHERRGEWDALHALLPELRRHDALPDADLDALTARIYRVRIGAAAARGDAEQAAVLWDEVPRTLRQDPTLVAPYASALNAAGRGDDAEMVIRSVLRQRWDDALALQYGQLQTTDAPKQLARAEAWLKERGDTPVLLLTCGRLCMRSGLWGKARSYLESSIASGARAETWHELAKLLQHTGEPEGANEATRRGLLTALGADTGIERLPAVRSSVQPRSDTTTRPGLRTTK